MAVPTPEEKYWNRFSSQLLLPSSAAITHITSPSLVDPATSKTANFAVTSGSRVQIYSARTRQVVKTITRFGVDDAAHSGHIRRDGRILVAGGDSGAIQAFDVNSRAILKTWKEHKQPVWLTRWSPWELTTLMSASDDKTVRLWDLPSSESTQTFVGHQDYVRCGAFLPGKLERMLVSGSYDQTVRIWDPRSPHRAAMIFKHAAAVESVLPMPGGNGLATAADNQLSILDLVGGKPLNILRNHQKTITSLSLASNGTRLVSGGLDGHVKVYETTGWNVVAGMKYPAPILSLQVVHSGPSQDDKHLVVGMQSGVLSIKTRLSGEEKAKAREKERVMQALLEGKGDQLAGQKRGRGWEKLQEAKKQSGAEADLVVEVEKKPRAKKDKTPWAVALKKGAYEKALDRILEAEFIDKRNETIRVLTELQHRSALRTALSGRDEVSLQPVIKWLLATIGQPQHTSLVVDVACLVLDLYAPDMVDAPRIWKQLTLLHEKVIKNVELAQDAIKIQGMMDLITTQ